eukprot:c7903_g1_i1.p1 GENE.c7903_g1_i1~~c7903_g1_i1.p1  ORF type:complete len:174 (+),score=18.80 c7903_g1_i1:26-523(+)
MRAVLVFLIVGGVVSIPPPNLWNRAMTVISDCTSPLTSPSLYYGAKKVSFGSISETFHYAISFSPNSTVAGTMYICSKSEGMTACGPYNCTDSFTYDPSTCGLTASTSACDENIAHTCTDMHITAVGFNSELDTMSLNFTSHMPGASGTLTLARTARLPITCPHA